PPPTLSLPPIHFSHLDPDRCHRLSHLACKPLRRRLQAPPLAPATHSPSSSRSSSPAALPVALGFRGRRRLHCRHGSGDSGGSSPDIYRAPHAAQPPGWCSSARHRAGTAASLTCRFPNGCCWTRPILPAPSAPSPAARLPRARRGPAGQGLLLPRSAAAATTQGHGAATMDFSSSSLR
uniref:Uncharacterized protein n=1 Tax=Triticum urartu TaxID=4572 RepID=A0A8R7V7Q3_TRIUA